MIAALVDAVRRRFGRARISIAAETTEWHIRCDTCGREKGLAEAGGVRWKAAGRKHVIGRCSSCSRLRWMTIYRHERDSASDR